jgi:arginyl-tRNA synthetase
MSSSDQVRRAIERAAKSALGDAAAQVLATATWVVERPKRPEHGDLATNAAMVLTKPLGMPPRAIAEKLVAALSGSELVAKAEIAGPGFVNLRLHPAVFHAIVRQVLEAGVGYGRVPSATRERIDVEFVSANPTGPITVAAARNAILGDAVARLLEATGNRVTREYYVNDFGNQIRLFAESVAAVHEGREVPEGGYQGGYVKELADFLAKVDPEALTGDRAALSRTCIAWMMRGIPGSDVLRGIKRTLADLGVVFDVWFSEESLHRWGAVAASLRQLEEGGHLVRKEGALFFVGKGAEADDKDRVVQKSDGAYTYFASDIAYHADKVARGYDRLINVLGVDHHGYVARVRNALEALGLPSERFDALLYNLVYIYRGGEVVKSSKRAGNVVTAEEIMEEIDAAAGREGAGRDALRFFYLLRSASQPIDFDIELAKKASLDNPVFYVQYGHARLSSILRKGAEMGYVPDASADLSKLVDPDELALAAKLGELPALVEGAAAAREPHRVAFWVQELARDFQSYFTRKKSDPILPQASERAKDGWEASWDHDKTRARLAWIEAIRTVYAGALALLGVSAPERMVRPEGSAEAEDEGG